VSAALVLCRPQQQANSKLGQASRAAAGIHKTKARSGQLTQADRWELFQADSE